MVEKPDQLRDGHSPSQMVPLTDTASGLAAALPAIAAQPRIAVDTEADSLHCYFEKLCLIQITVPGHDFLIDPLAGFDLTPLWDSWSGKELIFHGADYDLRLLRRTGCPRPARIFDTMIAARLCGLKEFSSWFDSCGCPPIPAFPLKGGRGVLGNSCENFHITES